MGEGQMQVVFDARTSESLTNMNLAASVMADQSTGSNSDCSDAGKTIPPSHDITSCHTVSDKITGDEDLSSRFKLPVSVGPQNTSVALSGKYI